MWGDMTAFQQTFLVIAIAATIIMIIMIIMMFIGMDDANSFEGSADDFDTDPNVDSFNDEPISGISGLRILTIRGVLAFLSIGSWTIYLLSDVLPSWGAILIGIAAGAVAAYLLAFALKQAMKLESSGNLNYHSAIGKIATIYIRVPAKRSGRGKVMINHQGKMIEVDALTDDKEDLLRNTEVVVTALEDDNTLLVKRQNKGE